MRLEFLVPDEYLVQPEKYGVRFQTSFSHFLDSIAGGRASYSAALIGTGALVRVQVSLSFPDEQFDKVHRELNGKNISPTVT